MPLPKDPVLKQRTFELRAASRTVDWIAEHLNVPTSTIYGWCREHRAEARAELLKITKDIEALSDQHRIPELFDLSARIKKAIRGLLV